MSEPSLDRAGPADNANPRSNAQRSLPEVDADGAGEIVDHAHVLQAKPAHLRLDPALGRVMLERFKDVGVGVGAAGEREPEYWHDQPEVTEINRAPKRIVWLAEIQH